MSIRFNMGIYWPNLNDDNYRETSQTSTEYNCIAWVAGDRNRHWEPSTDPTDAYWPPDVPREDTLGAYLDAFEFLGFEPCLDAEFEPGSEKIVVYTDSQNMFRHVAIQLTAQGEWSSKMGGLEDISRIDLEAVSGWFYGTPSFFMRRPIA